MGGGESGRFLKPAPKIGTNGFHKKNENCPTIVKTPPKMGGFWEIRRTLFNKVM
jgi:hypothetical protein